MNTGQNSKRRTAVILIATVVVVAGALSYIVLGIHTETNYTLNYTEKTRFVGNNTLVNGNSHASTSSGQAIGLSDIAFHPSDKMVYALGSHNTLRHLNLHRSGRKGILFDE